MFSTYLRNEILGDVWTQQMKHQYILLTKHDLNESIYTIQWKLPFSAILNSLGQLRHQKQRKSGHNTVVYIFYTFVNAA